MHRRTSHTAIGLGTVCLTAALVPLACTRGALEELTAETRWRVHPVLIRNDHNALLQVLVDVKRNDPVRLRAHTTRTRNLAEDIAIDDHV